MRKWGEMPGSGSVVVTFGMAGVSSALGEEPGATCCRFRPSASLRRFPKPAGALAS